MTTTTLDQLTDFVFFLLEAISAAAISALIYYGKQWISAKISGINNATILAILEQLDNIVADAVAQTQNLKVDQLKANNTFTPAEQMKALNDTTAVILKEIPVESVELLKTAGVQLETLIKSKIEFAVRNLKLQEDLLL